MRGDLGITYDQDVLRLIDAFRAIGLYVGSVVLTQYGGQSAADAFQSRLASLGVTVYRHYPIAGYPSDVEHIVSDEGYGKNEYIETTRPLVVITAPGPGSGKWRPVFPSFTMSTGAAWRRAMQNLRPSPSGICR